jgi:hypothetical protein
MDNDPNYLTSNELSALIVLLDGLNAVNISKIFVDEVVVRDSNAESLGKVIYRDAGYVFIPGDFDKDQA